MKTQGVLSLEFLLSEANGQRSRDVVVITGGKFSAGTVLGKVTAGGKYTQLDPAANDGSEVAVAVLADEVDASAADHTGLIVARDAEVSEELLQFDGAVSAPQKVTAIEELEAKGIIARASV